MRKGKEWVTDSAKWAWDIPSFKTEGPLFPEKPSVPGKLGKWVTVTKGVQRGK